MFRCAGGMGFGRIIGVRKMGSINFHKQRIDLVEADVADDPPLKEILRINEALEQLEREDPEPARIVVLKFFGGIHISRRR